MFPSDFAHALIVGIVSILAPRTWASYLANSERSSSYAGIWTVQTGVKASGKNARTTFFLPRKSDSFTSLSRCDIIVKSGASSPTFGALTGLAIEISSNDFQIQQNTV